MIDDARSLTPDSTLDVDLCIIGAGAAGLTIARSFIGRGLRVLVLEAGGYEADEAGTALYRGKNVGRKYFNLETCRRRYFGGSTNCWAGLCLPMRPIDFEAREWIPHSGWPFGRETLLPYYKQARSILGIGSVETELGEKQAGPKPVELAGPLVTDYFRMSRPVRLGTAWRKRFQAASDVRVLLNANVTRLVASSNGRRIERVEARTLEGPAFSVTARRVVVACGGLENPRLLLHSGVGNQHDLVGRYFMEHPHTDFEGLLVVGAPLAERGFYGTHRSGRERRWGLFRAPDALLRKEKLLDFSIVLLPVRKNVGVGRDAHPLAEAIGRAAAETDGIAEPATTQYTLGTPSEQAPNPESRVRLGRERDALGLPRIELDWRLTALDKQSVRRAHELMAQTVARSGLGRMKLTLTRDVTDWPPQVNGGRHHMGTTRMHTDPRQGVCDAHGFVHGVENLMVAGSSLFPTSGAANPTWTLVALALRAAERLQADLKG